MAVAIRVSITGLGETLKRLGKLNPEQNTRIISNGLEEIALRIQADAAKNQIVHGRGRGKHALPPLPDKLSSRNGGAGIVGSIRVNRGPGPKRAEVGSDKVYSAVHEFGINPFPQRAYLAPALEVVRPRIEEIIVKHWRKEAGL
jgi:hypothetical protein